MSDEVRRNEAIARFSSAYYEWLEARAAFEKPDLTDDERDAAGARADAAEMKLIATPAPVMWAAWQKWELLEWLITEERTVGIPPSSRVVPMAAALKAEIMAIKGA